MSAATNALAKVMQSEAAPLADSVDYRLSGFDSFQVALKPAHVTDIAGMAQRIVDSRRGASPIRCVKLVGHAATWRNVPTEQYFRNAMARGYTVADELSRVLRELGLSSKVFGETRLRAGPNAKRCKPVRGIAVALFVGSRGNTMPVAPNLIERSDRIARASRAKNRRVDVTLFIARRPAISPAPPITPARGRTLTNLPVRLRGDTNEDVRRFAKLSGRACGKAYRRMRALAAMSSDERRRAWNAGPEITWFGPYGTADPVAPFRLVKRFVDRTYAIFRGAPGYVPVSPFDPSKVLTIHSYRCGFPGRKSCRKLKDLEPPWNLSPVERWIKAASGGGDVGLSKLKSEHRAIDTRHLCCKSQDTMGLAFRSLGVDPTDPLRNPMEPRPHKIGLCPAWFRMPKLKGRQRKWGEVRRVTICHEVAHLAGVSKLALNPATGGYQDDEDYGLRAAKRLARRNPALARVNAENYGAYIMAFAPT